ncbi:selenoprotein L [Callorhinchus milii]|nr:selenoprotein L [Callorhinchus milii]
MAQPPGERVVVRALLELLQAGGQLLRTAVQEAGAGTAQEYVSQKIWHLAGMIQIYETFLKNLSVAKRSDAENLWKTLYHSAAVRDHVEDLLQFELDWNTFLRNVDVSLKTDCVGIQLGLGAQVPASMPFTDARSGKEVVLEEYQQHNMKLLLVLLRHFS